MYPAPGSGAENLRGVVHTRMMFFMQEGPRSWGVCSRWAGVVLFSLPLVGCALLGVEPDEIDFAGASESEEGVEEGETANASTGEGTDTNQGDSEDGDAGDGDGDPSGDGDGDAGGDGDGDASTGNDEAGDGDGDGDGLDETSCQELGATAVVLGTNDVTIAAVPSVLEGSCGHSGPEAIYSFVSEVAGNVEFALSADFDAALYAIDGLVCLPLVELECVNTPDLLTIAVEAGQTVHVVVDSAGPDGGSGTLEVAIVP